MSDLSRRALLRGTTAAIGLPLLQAMLPGKRLFAATPPAASAIPKRLCVIYFPHGFYGPNFVPAKTGAGFPLPPSLESLGPVAGRFSVLSNLKMFGTTAIAHGAGQLFLTNEDIAEGHLSIPNRLSMDRLVVKRNAGQTLLPSLELSLSSCAGLRNTISFDENGTPQLGQNNPRAVFERLFGSSVDPESQRAELRAERSILDGVRPQVQALKRRLGGEDQRVLDEHLESIRATESYLERLEKRIDQPTTPQAQGVALDRNVKVSERMRNMFDLTFLAFRADLTRVVTFTVFRERADSEMQYPELNLVGEHHGWSHGASDPKYREESIKALAAVDRLTCEQLAYFLKRLHDTPEGDGTLLDHTLVVFGSGLNGTHESSKLPILIAGGEKLGVRQGRHVAYEQPENLLNLNQTLLRIMLGEGCPQWKGSTRLLSELIA